MSKLTRKLLVRIIGALCVVFFLSFIVNTFFLPSYFLYQKKQKLAELTTEISASEHGVPISQIESLETQYEVAIAYASLKDSVNDINDQLLFQYNRKGIALSKFWLTEESISALREGARVNKFYDQTKLKSSFLVNFVKVGDTVFAVGESISHSSETIRIINQFNAYIWLGMLLLLILLSVLYTARIVKPLAKLSETAEAISNLSFAKVDIKTGDEIESLGRSINVMSDKLQQAQHSLEMKNANLRTFISDISHELKTPLSLIRVYASGIQDGLDDGTYARVIQQQSEELAGLIDRLLELSRLQAEVYDFEPVDLRQLLTETLHTYETVFQQHGLHVEVEDRWTAETWVLADRRKLESVLHNWMTNAVKYTSGDRITITLELKEEAAHFGIANETDKEEHEQWDQVWEPFYVMDSSRSKKFSGTGLGLSIARTILENHHADYGLSVADGKVMFYFSLPLIQR
ncbi:sensor histidine kinase [Paenibacillus taichungensis]|uniref:sensor histidine kinase n=1 Tax=Paenibacillus taichungensis TaxID=484184 RepID=UPI003D9A7811